ncbi:hypothetical protein AB1Y20_010583 [Prymnesium parvum]|uniref:Uncharacterized protein n=1 Tax=Prymnesium parvum TaxID=97485 RepID=A0AB34IRU0_PRYPA
MDLVLSIVRFCQPKEPELPDGRLSWLQRPKTVIYLGTGSANGIQPNLVRRQVAFWEARQRDLKRRELFNMMALEDVGEEGESDEEFQSIDELSLTASVSRTFGVHACSSRELSVNFNSALASVQQSITNFLNPPSKVKNRSTRVFHLHLAAGERVLG